MAASLHPRDMCTSVETHALDYDRPYTMSGFFCRICGEWIDDDISPEREITSGRSSS